jgi:hypothetical protein
MKKMNSQFQTPIKQINDAKGPNKAQKNTLKKKNPANKH